MAVADTQCIECGASYSQWEMNNGICPGCDHNPFEPCPSCGQDEFDCTCYLEVCCYDPRYQGPEGYCHCAAYSKQMQLESKWWYKGWRKAIYWRNEVQTNIARLIKKFKSKQVEPDPDGDGLPF